MKAILYFVLIFMGSFNSFAQDATILKNNLNVIPISTFSTFNWGVGVSYERLIGFKGKFGVNFPVFLAFQNDGFNVDAGEKNSNRIQLNPGIRYYPLRKKIMTYGVGVSYYYIKGKTEYWDLYTPGEHIYTMVQAGPMLNNYIGFNINKRFNIGMEFGIGLNIVNETKALSTGSRWQGPHEVMSQTNFHIGYRF